MTTTMQGTVKAVYPTPKGYGFIRRDGERDLFFHVADCVGGADTFETLQVGDRVCFELGRSRDNRIQAVSVLRASW